MKTKYLEAKRREIVNGLLGSWESEYITDSKNKNYRLVLTFNKEFGISDSNVTVKANKKYSSNDIRTCTLTFYWVDYELQTSNIEQLKQGMFKKINNNQLGLFKSNLPYVVDNLLLKFNRII